MNADCSVQIFLCDVSRYFYLRPPAALRGAAVGAEAELGVLHPLGGEVLALAPVVYYLDPRNGWRMQYSLDHPPYVIVVHFSHIYVRIF